MAVALPTGRFTVRRPTGVAGPVDGHASYRGGTDQPATDRRRQQVGTWTLLLDVGAWPVTEACTVSDATGRTWRVNTAELRDALPALAHVVVDADRTTVDLTADAGVDAEGNVITVPV